MKLQKYSGKQGSADFEAMSIEDARDLSYGDRVWFKTIHGDARQAKVNGMPKTWKRRPTVEVPLKYGLYEYFRVAIEPTLNKLGSRATHHPVVLLVEVTPYRYGQLAHG